MGKSLDLEVAAPRTYSTLFGGMAALAIVLMVIGMLGIAASATERQMRRAAISVALGASVRREIWRLILRAQVPVGLGLVVGIVTAHWSGSLLASQLVGVSATDPTTMAVTAAVLALISLFSAYLPARRFRDLKLSDLLREA
jgi:ABC-type antimicrobial peptide transport system permease subunit